MPYTKPEKSNQMLDFDRDLRVSADDVSRLNALCFRPDLTMEEYLDFLEEIGAFAARKPAPVIFKDIFTLS